MEYTALVCRGVIISYIFAYMHLDYNSAGVISIDFLHASICVRLHASAGIFRGVTGINSALGLITAACPGDIKTGVDRGLIMCPLGVSPTLEKYRVRVRQVGPTDLLIKEDCSKRQRAKDKQGHQN